MNWILLALLTACLYGVYNFFIKVASGSINQIVGAVILQVVAAVVGATILIFLRLFNQPLIISRQGIFWAVLAGVAVGLAEIASFFVFSRGLSASTGIPIIIGGSVLVGAILGVAFGKETLSVIHIFAIILIVAGVALLTTK